MRIKDAALSRTSHPGLIVTAPVPPNSRGLPCGIFYSVQVNLSRKSSILQANHHMKFHKAQNAVSDFFSALLGITSFPSLHKNKPEITEISSGMKRQYIGLPSQKFNKHALKLPIIRFFNISYVRRAIYHLEFGTCRKFTGNSTK